MDELALIADRSYKTYKARLKASDRLQARQRAWNTSLLALSIATTTASIGLLTDSQMYGAAGPTVLVCVSVLALIVSLTVAGLNYGVRSRDMFMNYRNLQRLSVEAEALEKEPHPDGAAVRKLRDRYNALLDDSENHTSADHKLANSSADVSVWQVRASALLTCAPYVALVVPVLIVIPFIEWALHGHP